MPAYTEHDITLASFAQVDREIGVHHFTEPEYIVARRIIHTTADFEFKQLLTFTSEPMAAAAIALQQGAPIITDVSMVAAGIRTVAARTWQPTVVAAVQHAPIQPLPHQAHNQTHNQTRSAEGMYRCVRDYPGAIVAIGNAPTALLSLCRDIASGHVQPAVVIGVPVGFINVVESKQALAALSVPHILVQGRKGGSAVAAAILNALMIWSWEQRS